MMDKERVADYPRPPRAELDPRRVRVVHGGVTVADTERAIRVCETASPPTFYVPLADVTPGLLEPADGSSFCEWKGAASYWSLRVGDAVVPNAAWGYENPDSRYPQLKDHIAFYASRVDECWVGDERATPQPGRFYGGWITSEVEGPFKGEPGTEHW
jgi:uncharacterized protein (DUF427 family)